METEPISQRISAWPRDQKGRTGRWQARSHTERLKSPYLELGAFRLVPLVQRKIRLACAVAITFLRRGAPGDVIHGGDLDNRLKTLLDALRMPQSLAELAEDQPDPESDGWFYCLLEDDCLITSLSVETHQLLIPLATGTNRNDVDLLLRIQLKPIDPTFAALTYL